jgi:two-component system, chemotaxis family, chemotaxis protein CheY
MSKILIVDDSNLILTLLEREIIQTMPKGSVELVKAHNGFEAIKKYKEEKPDLVFLDIIMPNIDGVVVLMEIIEHNPKAHVVIISSLYNEYYVKTAKRLGAVDYLSKPFKIEDIEIILEKYIPDWRN